MVLLWQMRFGSDLDGGGGGGGLIPSFRNRPSKIAIPGQPFWNGFSEIAIPEWLFQNSHFGRLFRIASFEKVIPEWLFGKAIPKCLFRKAIPKCLF